VFAPNSSDIQKDHFIRLLRRRPHRVGNPAPEVTQPNDDRPSAIGLKKPLHHSASLRQPISANMRSYSEALTTRIAINSPQSAPRIRRAPSFRLGPRFSRWLPKHLFEKRPAPNRHSVIDLPVDV
jgi:hypothetical protein